MHFPLTGEHNGAGFLSPKQMSSLLTDQTTEKNCSRCGASFGCGIKSTNADCWCMDLPRVAPVAAPEQDCLCRACLTEAISQLPSDVNEPTVRAGSQTSSPGSLVEGEDYYLEGSTMVFTAGFLFRRGYCCESGCRHCPFVASAAIPTARIQNNNS